MPNTKEKLIDLMLGWGGLSDDAEDIADHLIANGVTVQQWIPVEERLPECHVLDHCDAFDSNSSSDVLIMIDNTQIGLGRYCVWSDGLAEWSIWYSAGLGGGEVTHWMPIPEPPKEDTL